MKENKHEGYTPITLAYGVTIEEAVNQLHAHHANGELVCADFNDTMLYGDTVTLDSAYLAILGKTKAEHDKEKINRLKQQAEADAARSNQDPLTWRVRGRRILDPPKWDTWDEFVHLRLNVFDTYQGHDLTQCLDLIDCLNVGTLNDAKRLLDQQNHSGMSFSVVASMVEVLSDRGPEFIAYIQKEKK